MKKAGTGNKSNKRFDQSAAKRRQFQDKKGKAKKPVLLVVLLVLLLLGAIVAAGVYFARTYGSERAGLIGEPVLAERSYVGKVIPMTQVEATLEGEWLTLPLEAVDQYNIVSFEAENDEGSAVPLMAYVSPSGRIFAGSSMCEPCRGQTFSLAGETLVCDTCRTTYTLEEREFISGSPICGSYPPVSMEPVVEDGLIKLPLDNVLNWRLRAL